MKKQMEDFKVMEITLQDQRIQRGGGIVYTESMGCTNNPSAPGGWEDDCSSSVDSTSHTPEGSEIG